MNKYFGLLMSVLALTGCSSQLPQVSDEKIATDSLTKSLQAWKSGESLESLQKSQPPIYLNEQLWSRGVKLTDFTVYSGQRHGQGWNCEVELQVRMPEGQAGKRRINYQIDTHPNIVIVQQP